MRFDGSPLSTTEQVDKLASRGLVIKSRGLAVHYLTHISYYRFCGYGINFERKEADDKRYIPGTTFEQILDVYFFDRKVRLLIIDGIERIEVAIRAVMSNELALRHGAHWYLDPNLFIKKFKHDELIQTIQKGIHPKKTECFVEHYLNQYSTPSLPAIWMISEVLSLGTWSTMFANLNNREDQKIICKHFGLNYKVMKSWLHALTYLGNLCAHRSILWNRTFTLKPVIAKNYKNVLQNNSRFSAQAAIIKIFLDVISPDYQFSNYLKELLAQYSHVSITDMGFTRHWEKEMFWNKSSAFSGAILGGSVITNTQNSQNLAIDEII